MSRSLYVLGPNTTREEAADIRRLFAEDDLKVYVCSAAAHTPGQRLDGDVVVIGGTAARSAEQDATGKVTRYADMAAAMRARDHSKQGPAEAQRQAVVPEPPPQPQQEPQETAATSPDRLDTMDRVALIQYAAGKWPGQRRWATMSTDDLKNTIREMESGD